MCDEPPPYINNAKKKGIETVTIWDCSLSMLHPLDDNNPNLGSKFDFSLKCIIEFANTFALLDTEADEEIKEMKQKIISKYVTKNSNERELYKQIKEGLASYRAAIDKGFTKEEATQELINIRNKLRKLSNIPNKDIKETPLDYGAESSDEEDDLFHTTFNTIKKGYRHLFKDNEDMSKDEGGMMTYIFSKPDSKFTKCLGDINSSNLKSKIKDIVYGDCTYICPALEMMKTRYFKEQKEKSNKGIPWSPIPLVIIITDGHLDDIHDFKKLIVSEKYNDIYLLIAIIGEDRSAQRAIVQYEDIQSISPKRIKVQWFKKENNPSILVSSLLQMAGINTEEANQIIMTNTNALYI